MGGDAGWQQVLKERHDQYVDELLEFLRIPSVSTDPARAPDVLRAAEWTAARLARAGLENVEITPTGAHACVYGDWLHAAGKPTLLIYGHFDVQPADPLDLWTSPPFEPVIKDGRVYARGAADMKGNLLLSVAAVEAVLAAEGALPVNVKFILEGQEEIGSPDLPAYLTLNRDRLACDFVVTPDGGQWGEDQPAVYLGTKGLCALQVDIETAAMDLHSGMYGGAIPNANHALESLLATMKAPDGLILVDGFYDQVKPLTQEERDAFAAIPYNEAAYRGEIGVDALIGEPGYTTYERAWARPTLEFNGIWGGYQGDGVKTVIPAKAHAKITCRLVADQDPDDMLACLERHVTIHCPPGARTSTTRLAGKSRPYLVPRNLPGVQAVAEVLADVYGKPPFDVRTGGTLPILDGFLQELHAYTAPFGFGLDDECIHSPNEFMRHKNFERGMVAYAKFLERFGA
jgi:acetylornithine deacetylase/succinyl-diaminopimelate desuccinylase-like protein